MTFALLYVYKWPISEVLFLESARVALGAYKDACVSIHSLRRESRFEGETSAGYIRGPQDHDNDRCRRVHRSR